MNDSVAKKTGLNIHMIRPLYNFSRSIPYFACNFKMLSNGLNDLFSRLLKRREFHARKKKLKKDWFLNWRVVVVMVEGMLNINHSSKLRNGHYTSIG
jgi:hypothetical protein